jgi:hypothetical protein
LGGECNNAILEALDLSCTDCNGENGTSLNDGGASPPSSSSLSSSCRPCRHRHTFHWSIGSLMHPSVHSDSHPSVYFSMHPSIHSFIIHSFIYPFIH